MMRNYQMMKHNIIIFVIGAIVLSSCAKAPETNAGMAAKEYFDAWMYVNHPNLTPTPLGAYVLSETSGEGRLAGDIEAGPYVRVNFTATDLYGNIATSTYVDVNQQAGLYEENSYYGPRIWCRIGDILYAGVDEAVSTMRVGGKKKSIIPGWLFAQTRYETQEEYIKNVSSTNAIYDIELLEVIDDIEKWEIDSLSRFIDKNYPSKGSADSLKYGFYYIQNKAPKDTAHFPNDTTVYINYIGRTLDGKVFDTTIKDTAKFYGIYASSKTYEPMSINWSHDDYNDITMGDDNNSTIPGFSYALWNMRSYESGRAVFYSGLGYGSSGTGNSIPEYAPLIFDIEFVDKEN